jgi:hypothetical protein
MEPWSEELPADFLARLFLDTNILCYYVDADFPSLNRSLDLLFKSPFVSLLSSQAVLLELASLRKRLLYFRRVLHYFPGTYSAGTAITQKLWLKINRYQNCPELLYRAVRDDVKRAVLAEINELRESCPQIDFEYSRYHEGLYEPAANLVLSSNFSRHDSLVFISALLPAHMQPENGLYFTTRDGDLITLTGDAELGQLCLELGLNKPLAERITSLRAATGGTVNLTLPMTDAQLESFWKAKIIELLLFKNQDYYLGTTFAPHSPAGWPANAIPLKLAKGRSLIAGASLLVIGKDLDFVYNIKVPVDEYHQSGTPVVLPFTAAKVTNLSFLSFDFDGVSIVPTPHAIVDRLRDGEHYVFVNPDSLS